MVTEKYFIYDFGEIVWWGFSMVHITMVKVLVKIMCVFLADTGCYRTVTTEISLLIYFSFVSTYFTEKSI